MEFIKRKIRIGPLSGKRKSDIKSFSKNKREFSNQVQFYAITSCWDLERVNYDPGVCDQQQICRCLRSRVPEGMKATHCCGLLNDAMFLNDFNQNCSRRNKRWVAMKDCDSNKLRNETLANDIGVLNHKENRRSFANHPRQSDAAILMSSNYSNERYIMSAQRKWMKSKENDNIKFDCDLVNMWTCDGDCEKCNEEWQYVLVTPKENTDRMHGGVVEVHKAVNDVTFQVTPGDVLGEKRMHSSSSSLASVNSSVSSNSATRGSYTLWHSMDDVSELDDSDDVNKNDLTPERCRSCSVCTCGSVRYCECEMLSENRKLKTKLLPIQGDFESNESITSVEFEVKPKLKPTFDSKSATEFNDSHRHRKLVVSTFDDREEQPSIMCTQEISFSHQDETFRDGQSFEMEQIKVGNPRSLEERNARTNMHPKPKPAGHQMMVIHNLSKVDNNSTTKKNLKLGSESPVKFATGVVTEKTKHNLQIVKIAQDGKDHSSLNSAANVNNINTPEQSTSIAMDGKESRHVAWALANNAAAIILLLDHKMCEGTWIKTESESRERSSSQVLPDGFSYGEEKKLIQLSPEDTSMQSPSTPEKMPSPKPGHKRSKSFGTSVSRAITDAVNKLEEMSHESRNKQYHKLFKFVPDDEGLIVSFSCALVRDILLQGRLYLSENWVCFHSNIFTFETQVSVSMEEIQNITKERTVFVVPNAIGIHTDTHKYVFGSLLSRHSTYKQLVKVWQRRYMLDETTSQDSGSRVESEQEVLDGEEIALEEGEEADIEEEDADTPLLSSENPPTRLQCEVHTHSHQSEFEERRPPSRKTSSTTQQMEPSRLQIIQAQILTLIQAVLAISIYKSLRRFCKHQPFLAFSSMMFFVLTVSAAILCYKILTFQSQDESLLQDAYKKLSGLGNVFLSHHQHNHEKISQLQEKLVNQLQNLVQDQSETHNSQDDEVS